MESTLTLKKSDFKVRVASNLGWGLGPDYGDPAWSPREEFHLKDFIDSGYRQFITTPPIPGFHQGAYKWSFLQPTATLTLASGESVVALPDDFGGTEGRLFMSVDGGTASVLEFGGPGAVTMQQAAHPDTTGRPTCVCVEPTRGTTLLNGQRMQLRFWPLADQAYTLQFRYYFHPNALTEISPIAYGGPQHSETLLESCLAVSELRLDNVSEGPHWKQFMQNLTASIIADTRLKASTLGYNRDLSDGRRMHNGRPYGYGGVLVNGVQY